MDSIRYLYRGVLLFSTILALFANRKLYSGIGFGFDMNYMSLSGTTEGTYRVGTGDAAGYTFSPHLRYNFKLGDSAILGVGAWGGLGSIANSDLSPTVTSDSVSVFRIGGELYLGYGSSTAFALPFIRAQAAKEFITAETVYKVGSTTPTISVSYGGLVINLLGGFKIPFNDVLAMYIQGGVSIAPQSSSSAKNTTNDATAISVATAYNALNPKISYTGFMLGGGLSFDF